MEFTEDSGSDYIPPGYCSDRSHVSDSASDNNMSTHCSEDQEAVPKKRSRNVHLWKKNIRKAKKIRGETYTNATGNIINAKTFQPIICKSFKKFHNFVSDAKQKELNDAFYNLGNYDLQTAYLFGLIKVINKKRTYKGTVDSDKRSFSREYYLPIGGKEERVCKMFFIELFSVSDGRITRLLKTKLVGGTPPQDQRGKHSGNKTNNTIINKIKDFINTFSSYESHYSRIKNLNRKYLSPSLNLKIIYNLYKNEISEPVSYYVFKDVFNKEFNLHFHAPISDSCKKCDIFVMLLI